MSGLPAGTPGATGVVGGSGHGGGHGRMAVVESSPAARAELFRALGVLCEAPHPAHRAVADGLGLSGWPSAEEDDGLFTTLLPPYAAIHLGPEGMLGGVAADRVAGFWRALGYDAPAEPDHLAALLGLYAALVELEDATEQAAGGPSEDGTAARARLLGQARAALLAEHLLSWVPGYATAVTANGAAHHRAWAEALLGSLVAEAAALDAVPTLSAHLRDDVPGLPGPEEGVDAFIRALLAPVRSGVVLTRDDLLRGARELGLGLRIGERAFVLRTLLEADPVAVLGLLADLADAWAARHAAMPEAVGPATGHWHARAEASAAALRLQRDRIETELATSSA